MKTQRRRRRKGSRSFWKPSRAGRRGLSPLHGRALRVEPLEDRRLLTVTQPPFSWEPPVFPFAPPPLPVPVDVPFFVVNSAPVAEYQDVVMLDDPFAYYRLGEPAGATTAVDETGVHHGTYVNDPTLEVPGAILTDPDDTAAQLDATQYVEGTTMADYGSRMIDGFTIECWVRMSVPTGWQNILGTANPGYTTNVQLAVDQTKSMRLYFRDDDWDRYSVWFYSEGDNAEIFDEEWHHLVFAYNPIPANPSDRFDLYIDSVPQELEVQPGNDRPDGTADFVYPMILGGWHQRGTVVPTYEGDLDEVAFYTRPLAWTEAGEHYGAAVGNLVPMAIDDAYYVDENTPLVVTAESGLLANDGDADGDPLEAILVSAPSHGELTEMSDDGSFIYTPDADFRGVDTFTYMATDGEADSNVATVMIGVSPNVVVNSTADPGDGTPDATETTLREAIDAANAIPGTQTILFDVPTSDPGYDAGTGAFTIRPRFALPEITDPVLLDAWTQPGFAGTPIIELDGSLAGTDGLVIATDNSTVRGLVINRFSGNGIVLDGGSHNAIEGCYLGTDVSGLVALGNGADGVRISEGARANRVGTNGDGVADEAERNVISGNTLSGVGIEHVGTDDNVVAGNYIGTDVSGTVALPNGAGVVIVSGSHGNLIGANGDGLADEAERNVISGNSANGVAIWGAGCLYNVVAGNYIGTDVTGTIALGNGARGVLIADGAGANLIGTNGDGVADDAERNVIAANLAYGIVITGEGTDSNVVAGNYIGTDVSGTVALGNGFGIEWGRGIWISYGAQGNLIGTDGDGVADASERNVISGNSQGGVVIQTVGTDHNVVAGNYIGTDATGTTALGNGDQGVLINNWTETEGGPQGNLIGTDGDGVADEAERNVISANAGHGVLILGEGVSSNVVAGNYIGTDATGTVALGNEGCGVDLLDGAASNLIGTDGDGLADEAERNVISGNASHGITICGAGANRNVVAGNYVGTDVTGTVALGNGFGVDWGNGILIDPGPEHNLIGTNGDGVADEAERNIISGNSANGVAISGAGCKYNVVAGNYIGTDVTGTVALGNGFGVEWGSGVAVGNGARLNLIGTDADGLADEAERNVISGNQSFGVDLTGNATSDNVVAGNFIGTDVTGTAAIGNARSGVKIWWAGDQRIGGSNPVERNLISGNAVHGIFIQGADATGNLVQGNYIGTDVSGTEALGNLGAGVSVTDGASSNLIGTDGDGVADEAERNVISANTYDGVVIIGTGVDFNIVAGNYIGTDASGNAALGNGRFGVNVGNGARSNRIGTDGDGVADEAERNVVSANASHGVVIHGAGTDSNVLAGNYIGTDVSGTVALGNGFGVEWGYGVVIHSGAQSNRIGTKGDGVADASERNVISANADRGVCIWGTGTDGNVVAGNYIGTDAGGTNPLGNGDHGVYITDWKGAPQANLIGTNGDGIADEAERNVISANALDGVHIRGAGTNFNVVAGNYIGTDATGTVALGNGGEGVTVSAGAQSNRIGVAEVFREVGGQVVVEAETCSARKAVEGREWLVVPGEDPGEPAHANYRGAGFLQVLPDTGDLWTDPLGAPGPFVDYRIQIDTPGDYQLYVRWDSHDYGSNSFYARILELGDGLGGSVADWYRWSGDDGPVDADFATDPWMGDAAFESTSGGGDDVAAVWSIATPGIYTLRFIMRESGAAIDTFVLQLASLAAPTGDGPAASAATGNTAERNVISGNSSHGVLITGDGTDLNVVAGNYIGTDVTGTAALGNGFGVEWGYGVLIDAGAKHNLIGTDGDDSADASERNVISANSKSGVVMAGTGTDHNVVAGNYIGTDISGTEALGNGSHGVIILEYNGAPQRNRIGTDGNGIADEAERNVISGNSSHGVLITGAGTDLNVVAGNYIGTDVTGTAALGNGFGVEWGYGVLIGAGAKHNLIGTDGDDVADASERNVISANSKSGVVIAWTGTDHNVVAGNYIGTDESGTGALGNGSHGVIILEYEGAPQQNLIGTDGNGIADDAERNVISGNTDDGVHIHGAGVEFNVVAGNFIGTDVTGTVPLGNSGEGVWVGEGAQSNRIGVGEVFREVGGQVVVEAETYSARKAVEGREWLVVPGEDPGEPAHANYRGAGFLQVLPDTGDLWTDPLGSPGPFVDYRIQIDTPGDYRLFVRWDSHDFGSDSFYARILELGDGLGGTVADWYRWSGFGGLVDADFATDLWAGDAAFEPSSASGALVPALWSIATPGTYTLRFIMRESGAAIDTFVLQLASLVAPTGDGPAASAATMGNAAERNVIAWNAGAGVVVVGDDTTGNRIQANSIHDNGGLGIDLGGDGPTPNAPTHGDGTLSRWQNYPVITGALVGASTRVIGTLGSPPNADYTLDFYANTAADPTGFGEGERWLGSAVVTTDASGNAAFNLLLPSETTSGELITATATDPDGNTSEFSAAQDARTVDLGTVAFEELLELDLSEGEIWFRLKTCRAGDLTVEAVYDPAAGTAELTLFDKDRHPLATSSTGAGHERIDHQTPGAGEVFWIELTGTNPRVDLRLCNQVGHTDSRVSVYGTDGDDRFEFEAYVQPPGGLLGAVDHRVTINGVAYTFTLPTIPPPVLFVTFDGGGDDTAVFHGSAGDERVKLWPDRGRVDGFGYTVITKNVEAATAYGGGGADVASLYDSQGPDAFTAGPDSAEMTGPGFVLAVHDFPQVHAFASDDGQTDTAILEDLAGSKDRFRAWSTEAKMCGLGFYNRAKGFDDVQAGASDAADVAEIHDSPGADAFDAYADRATMSYEDGTVVRADDFGSVFAFASDDGHTDTARLYDTTANPATSYATWFKGFNGVAKMYEVSTFYNRVDGFDEVIASAVGGDDTAKLFDSPGPDDLEAYADQATMSYPDGTTVRADDFRWVLGYASDDGQVDTARFYDTTADLGTSYATWFKAENTLSRMYADPVFYVQAKGFDGVTASAVGSDDTAKLYDSALDDVYWSRPDHSRMKYGDGAYAEALDFRYMLGYSREGSDTATLYDETAGGTSYAARFAGYATWAKLYHGAFYSRTEGFAELRAALGGNDDLAWLEDDPTRVDHLVVSQPNPFIAAPQAKLWNDRRAIYIDYFHTLTATTSQDFVDDAHIHSAYEDDVILKGRWADA